MADVIPAAATVRVPVAGTQDFFPVRRIYCVGRNFAEHAREMGAPVAEFGSDRGSPVFFCKPADAIVIDGRLPYPRGTHNLHHEVELVVAVGADAPQGLIQPDDAAKFVFGYAVGLDLTRRDLQSDAKSRGLPWDTGKAFDHSAPISAIVPAAKVGDLQARTIRLDVNGSQRQIGHLHDLVWNVGDILHELSKLFALKAGDLIFMGTPAGVAALEPGDTYVARLDGLATLRGEILPA